MKGSASNSPTPMETASVEVKNVKRTRAESESGSEASAGNARKRGRRTKAEVEVELEAKRVKLTSVGETRGIGQVLTLGQGDTGQLGLGEDVMEKSRPALVKDIEAAAQTSEADIPGRVNQLKARAKAPDHLLDHQPPNPECEACISAKMRDVQHFRGAFDRNPQE